MSPALLAAWIVAGATAPAPAPWTVCVVDGGPPAGAGVAELVDALAVEARKRGREVRVTTAPAAADCDAGIVVTLASPATVATASRTRALAVEPLRPVDRAAEIARLVAAEALAAEAPADAALVGELPTPAPPPEVIAPPALLPPPAAPAPGVRAAVAVAAAADPGASSLFGRLEVSLLASLAGDGFALGARVELSTPTTAGAAPVTARSTELGVYAVVALRARLSAALALGGEVGLGAAHRWTTAQAAAVDANPAAHVDHTGLAASVDAGLWLDWRLGAGPLWLAVGVTGRRYLGGTDLAAPAGRVAAPRWSLGGGLRAGVEL